MTRPLCQCRACDAPAVWSVWQSAWRSRPERQRLMCNEHKQAYFDPTPIKGLDRPLGASDEWCPSIIEAVRHADIEIRRQERASDARPVAASDFLLKRQLNFTTAQRSQLAYLHRALSHPNQTEPK